MRSGPITKYKNPMLDLTYTIKQPAGTQSCKFQYDRYYTAIFSDQYGNELPFSNSIKFDERMFNEVPSTLNIKIVGNGYDSNLKRTQIPLKEANARFISDCSK